MIATLNLVWTFITLLLHACFPFIYFPVILVINLTSVPAVLNRYYLCKRLHIRSYIYSKLYQSNKLQSLRYTLYKLSTQGRPRHSAFHTGYWQGCSVRGWCRNWGGCDPIQEESSISSSFYISTWWALGCRGYLWKARHQCLIEVKAPSFSSNTTY